MNSSNDRNEVVHMSGLSISVGMALMGILFVVGIGLWLHNISLFREQRRHADEMTILYADVRQKKNTIVAVEGVASWVETSYVKTYGAGTGLVPD